MELRRHYRTGEEHVTRAGADAHRACDSTSARWANDVHEMTGGAGVDIALEAGSPNSFEQSLGALGAFGTLVLRVPMQRLTEVVRARERPVRPM